MAAAALEKLGATLLNRRSFFLVGFGAVAAALGAVTLEATAKKEALATDPDGERFVYHDGVITRVN